MRDENNEFAAKVTRVTNRRLHISKKRYAVSTVIPLRLETQTADTIGDCGERCAYNTLDLITLF